jgi:uracil-DNA glycosylase
MFDRSCTPGSCRQRAAENEDRRDALAERNEWRNVAPYLLTLRLTPYYHPLYLDKLTKEDP